MLSRALEALKATLIFIAVNVIIGLLPFWNSDTSFSLGLGVFLLIICSPVIFLIAVAVDLGRERIPVLRDHRYWTYILLPFICYAILYLYVLLFWIWGTIKNS